SDTAQAAEYTCSMHPQIRRKEPGICPICQMDLVPVTEEAAVGRRQFATSEQALALMDVEVTPVRRQFVTAPIRMVGKVDYDETRVETIAAYVPGRLDRLYVDYTGVSVKEGDHLVSIYSPELLSAQEELLQAKKAVEEIRNSNSQMVRQSVQSTLEAVREKLRLMGLNAEQIRKIEQTGTTSDHLTVYSPRSGIVIHKNAREGMYVKTGEKIYTLADLSQMWVRLDAYESDLAWLRYGQDVAFTTVSYPGEEFHGTISFIDPVLDAVTRTVKVRVNVPNPEGKLKPGMFVRAVVNSRVAKGGKVIDPNLAGKHICPMHPDVVKDDRGDCDICGMPLVTAESLGYVPAKQTEASKPLVIPVSAALVTGKRAVVYVREDPSLLDMKSVSNWGSLLGDLQAHHQEATDTQPTSLTAAAPVNTTCPIMGGKVANKDIDPDLTRTFDGKTVGFCCAGCPQQWDELSDAEKREKLAAVLNRRAPMRMFWKALSDDLRAEILLVNELHAPPMEVKHELIAQINRMLQSREFYAGADWPKAVLTPEIEKLLETGPKNLPPMELTRLNRLLLNSLFPTGIVEPLNKPLFEGREVVLGPRAGKHYIVRDGLAEGELVVTQGNFKIDSAMQIQAKPSMMNPTGEKTGGGGHQH
ncbi:MAG: efflux RND transporter periplasmic adaptor subunit, partial [Phycisphaerae bacterium]